MDDGRRVTRRGEDLWPGDNESAWKEQRKGVALRGGRVSQGVKVRPFAGARVDTVSPSAAEAGGV